MKPNEIRQAIQQSPPLRLLLGKKLWKFLRDEVEEVPEGSPFDYPRHTCFQCQQKQNCIYQSPYSEPGALWCLLCIVRAYFNPDIERYNPCIDTEVAGVSCWIIDEEELSDEDSWD